MPVDESPDTGLVLATEIQEHKCRLASENAADVLESMEYFSKILAARLTIETTGCALVDAGLIPEFMRLLKGCANVAMAVRLQSARCLANVASCTSERTRAVVDAGAVPLLLSLISPQSTESDDADTVRLCDECVWALGNICADGPALRDVCMSEGLPVKFFELLAHVNARGEKAHVLGITSTRILLWASSCMLRGAPSLGQAHSHHLLRLVRAVGGLIWLHDEEARTYILGGLRCMAEVDLEGAREVACTTDLSVVVALLRDVEGDSGNRALALRLLGKLVMSNDAITQTVVDAGGVGAFLSIAVDKDETLAFKMTAFRALSNVAGQSKKQCMAVALHPQMQALCSLIPTLPSVLLGEGLSIVVEACRSKDTHIVDAVIAGGGMAALTSCLTLDDATAKLALVGMIFILRTPPDNPRAGEEGGGPRSRVLQAVGGVGVVEDLQHHPNEDVCCLAKHIIVTYFAADSE